jgi:UDP-glucuronate decarboxylase
MDTSDSIVGPVNVGNPRECTIRELAERVIAMTGSRSKLVYQPLPPDDPVQRCPEITRAREWLKWEPKVDLETGLSRTIEYFEKLMAKPS